jgi:hypothetical protein
MKIDRLKAVSADGAPIFAFIDDCGRTIAQAVGMSAARALKEYLKWIGISL